MTPTGPAPSNGNDRTMPRSPARWWGLGLLGLSLTGCAVAALAQSVEGGSGAPIITLPGEVAPSAAPPQAPAAAGMSGLRDPEPIAPPAEQPPPLERQEDGAVELPANTPATWAPTIVYEDGGAEASSGGIVSGPTGTPMARTGSARAVRPSGGGATLADVGGADTSDLPTSGGSVRERLDRRERRIDPEKHRRILALSRSLGGLHAVRVRCGGRDDQTYRARMATLLDIEAPQGSTVRGEMVSAFNQGFNGQGRGEGACTPQTGSLEQTLARQGQVIALELAGLYRPPAATAQPATPAASAAQGAARPADTSRKAQSARQ
jgi:uncharacterized protein (TIGR02301 family)